MFAGHINLWGDWPVHIGIVSSFVDGANFPPEHPRFAGHAFAYHYLSDLTAAAQVTLGMDIPGALSLHSYILCVLVAIGLYAFARRFTRNTGAATLAARPVPAGRRTRLGRHRGRRRAFPRPARDAVRRSPGTATSRAT